MHSSNEAVGVPIPIIPSSNTPLLQHSILFTLTSPLQMLKTPLCSLRALLITT